MDMPMKEGNKKKKVFTVLLILMIVTIVGAILYYTIFQKKEQEMAMPPDRENRQDRISEDMVSASGITAVGIVEEVFEQDYIESRLYIEEVYLSSNEKVEAGTRILKLSEESVADARTELEDALTEADLAYRAGVIAYEQSKITAQYDYSLAILTGQQAQEVYDETVADLQSAVDEAQNEVDDAIEQIQEYTEGLADDNAGYDEEYQVTVRFRMQPMDCRSFSFR